MFNRKRSDHNINKILYRLHSKVVLTAACDGKTCSLSYPLIMYRTNRTMEMHPTDRFCPRRYI